MEMELFLNECPGIPKCGIFKPKNCTNIFMQKTHGFVITKFVFKPITRVSAFFLYSCGWVVLIAIYEFAHSLCTFLSHATHGAIAHDGGLRADGEQKMTASLYKLPTHATIETE